jgi:hypothetical protein
MHGERSIARGRSMAVSALKDWAVALEEFVERKAVAVPPEFKSAAEIAKIWGYTQSHASKMLNSMARNGRAEIKKFSVMVETANKNKYGPRRSYSRLTPFYRLIAGKSPKS